MRLRQMIRSRSMAALLCAAAVGGYFLWNGLTSAVAKDESELSKFMRKKLEASSLILEGLATEDADLIHQGSETILQMSKAELWNVLLDDDYRDFNRDFRSSMRKLDQAAVEKNFDNALLQWMDALKGCVECHKYVRDQRPKVKS